MHVVACAHGTDNPHGRRLVDGLRDDLAVQLAADGIDAAVHEAYVDVQEPRLGAVLAALPPGEEAIVAPLLLSEGFHSRVDIADAAAARPHTGVSAPVGPDPRLAAVLARRLAEAGHRPGDAVVLAAAGTRVEAGALQAARMAGLLAAELGQEVAVAYCSAAAPSVPEAVAAARAEGARRVGVASFLLAPGFFHDRLAGSGADYVSGALLPGVTIAKCVAGRLSEALSAGSADTE
ncbi:sirohydrochlorin cobaltochelatase [Paeniglutamicibacter sp. ABSL32-1]|nr:CbiX/SirB N-terminal domain-containing protein [Paeniglutamicibacter quisquiliarum]MBV1778301.1 sirohydrochlorin cobaltochelatase [Paeniglutamicibacter quisquiliarum]